jgi:hypothetical protein
MSLYFFLIYVSQKLFPTLFLLLNTLNLPCLRKNERKVDILSLI